MIPVFTGTVIQGQIKKDTPQRFVDYVQTLEGKQVEIIVRNKKAQRSNNQNNYYFGVVCKLLGDYFGYEPDEMHEALKLKFLQVGACDVPTLKSTTKLNTAEFEEYLERIRRWAAVDYGITVPLPNEVEA